MSQTYEPHSAELVRTGCGSDVTAIVPLRHGFDATLLFDALVTLTHSLAGTPPDLLYACHPEDVARVEGVVDDVLDERGIEFEDARGFTVTGTNVAATRNYLLAKAHTTYVVQADGDDVWVPGAMATLKWQLDRNPELAAAHGKHLDVSAKAAAVTFDPPDWWFEFPRGIARPGELAARRAEKRKAQAAWHKRDDYVAIYPSHPSAGLFRTKALLEVGGWDERLGNYFEDTAMVAKLQAVNSMYVCANPTMLYRTGQPGSLSRRPVNREGWQVLDRIAVAYENGLPDLAPAPPFDAPAAGAMPATV